MPRKLHDSGFADWSPTQLPSLEGKTYLITGGNSGIGLEAAKMLAGAGGRVVIASRNAERGRRAVDEVAQAASAPVDLLQLDLADMASVRAAAREAHDRFAQLDGLIDNAAVMQTPQQKTADGFELQFGTNHLGHFLLTYLLFDLVEKAGGRIVVVSSLAHTRGVIDFNDLMLTNNYEPTRAYCQSKLANLLFMFELDRRLKRSGSGVTTYGCHPGWSATRLQSTGPTGMLKAFYAIANRLLAQPAYNGALPTVLCAAGAEAMPGGYYGPQARGGLRGPVSDAVVADAALNEADAARLWSESEKLLGISWDEVLKAA